MLPSEDRIPTDDTRLREVAEALPEMILIIDASRIVFINAYGADMLGAASPDSLLGTPVIDYIHPDFRPRIMERMQQLQTAGEALPLIDVVMLREDGSEVYTETRSMPLIFEHKPCILVMGRDVTDQRRAEEKLQESEAKFRALFETMDLGVVYQDPEGHITSANPAAERILGLGSNHMVDRTSDDSRWQAIREDGTPFPGEEHPSMVALSTGRPVNNVVMGVWNPAKEERCWLLVNAVPEFRNDHPEAHQVYTTFNDITLLKRAENALRRSEERFRNIVESTPMGIHTYRLEGKNELMFTGSNPAADAILGVDNSQFVGMTIESAFPPLAATEIPERYKDVVRNRRTWQAEQIDYKDRKIQGAYEVHAFATDPGSMAVMFQDISRQKQTEANLKESESRFRTLFEFAPDAYYLNDLEGNFIDGNRSAEEMTGYRREELIGRSFLDLDLLPIDLFEKAAAYMEKNIAGESTGPDEWVLRRKGGDLINVEITTMPIDIRGEHVVLGIARDISQRKKTEEEQKYLQKQMQHMQKMEALGSLAGGIAHDFNNILSAIIGYSEIALTDAPPNSQLEGNIRKVLQAGQRATDLVRQILAFSRQSDIEPRPVQVKIITKEVLKLLRPTLPANIEIRSQLTSESAVMADPIHIHQVLMNLCTNAAHAMAESGGVLEVSLEEVELTWDTAPPQPIITPGRYLELVVEDSGHGIPPHMIDRVFDPFFTTKEKGKGTGMGLAVVHGIIQSHHGSISVESTPGSGTRFTVLLPVIDTEVRLDPTPVDSLPIGDETILFVDDEPFQADIGAQMLGRLGYRVEAYTDPEEALAEVRQQPDRFDLVITDMTMPRMTGDMLAGEISNLRPDIPIIICTGYSERIDEERAKRMGISGFVLKPMVMKDMARMIREVLEDNNG